MRAEASAGTLLSVAELLALQQQSEPPLLVDCRFDLLRPQAGEQAYRSAHLPGAHYAHLDHDLAGEVSSSGSGGRHPLPRAQDFARRLAAWGLRPDRWLVAYDDAGGTIAARLWWLLRALGHTRVAVLDGGLAAWQAAGLPLGSESPATKEHSETDFIVGLDPWPQMPTLSVQGLQSGLESGGCLLLDARAAPRYAGEIEPIDACAGHVPGAINRPFSDNLDERGQFRPAEALHSAFAELLLQQGINDPAAVVHMCGSGVTACHNLLAMEHAGWPGSQLYVGSWSDWISDPERPRAKV